MPSLSAPRLREVVAYEKSAELTGSKFLSHPPAVVSAMQKQTSVQNWRYFLYPDKETTSLPTFAT